MSKVLHDKPDLPEVDDGDFYLPPIDEIGPEILALPMAGEVNWGMEVMKINDLRTKVKGKDVKIGGIDTGIDPDHPIIKPGFKGAKSFVNGQTWYDGNGHGTHISGTVAGADPRIGVAAGFPLYHGKGLSNQGSGGAGLYDAMWWCFNDMGCDILSCSWGGGTLSPSVDAFLKKLATHPRKPWPIFAAGNSGAGTQQTDAPGNSMHVINTAALQPNLAPASFTSSGTKIDTAGPGVNIISAKPGGGYVNMSGTSMATPWNAGCLALYRQYLVENNLYIPDVYELRAALAYRSTDTHTPGDDTRTGPGWITPLLMLFGATPDPLPIQP